MKNSYSIRLAPTRIAVADLTCMNGKDYDTPEIPDTVVWELNRINVPNGFRGEGHGSDLLTQVTEDADASEVCLVLSINPYGDLTYEQLQEWYERYGFQQVGDDNLFVRFPEILVS